MQNREISYELNLTTDMQGFPIDSLRDVIDAVEKQLPEKGNITIKIDDVRIYPKQTQAISAP